ncbi:MAG: hypothetical protein FJ271_15115 [Planctomycetes bacterium]|nr:hypothetical protein [Planctomycetota bacterium]
MPVGAAEWEDGEVLAECRKPVAKPRKAGKLASSSRRVPAHQDNQENDTNLTRGESDRCGNNLF